MMELNDPRLQALSLILKVGFAAWEGYTRGELSEDNLDRTLDEIRKQSAAEDGWHASKQTPAAKARREESASD